MCNNFSDCIYHSLIKIIDRNFAVSFEYPMSFRLQLRNPGSDVCIDTLAANEHGSFQLGLFPCQKGTNQVATHTHNLIQPLVIPCYAVISARCKSPVKYTSPCKIYVIRG